MSRRIPHIYERQAHFVRSLDVSKSQGTLADACRTELRKLFDGLLDWELSGGAVTEARSPAAENGGAPP